MSTRRTQVCRLAIAAMLLVASSGGARAIEVLDNLPQNALGFVVVRDLTQLDARITKLLETVELPFPGPLALLRATTGIGEGLNPKGDLLIAVLPGRNASDRPKFAVWIPMNDYPRFLASVQGAAGDRVTAVTVAGEDLLVAQHGPWALLMDPTERALVERTVAVAPPNEARFSKWRSWMDGNDITAAMLPGGIRALVTWVMSPVDDGAESASSNAGSADDELFEINDQREQATLQSTEDARPIAEASSTARLVIQRWIREAPSLMLWAVHTDAVACGLRLDDSGNAVVGTRWSWRPGPGIPTSASVANAAAAAAPEMFQGGEFIATGGGSIPPEFAVEAAALYARWLVRGLEHDTRTKFDAQAVAEFIDAMKHAAREVRASAVLTRSGAGNEGVYTNSFLAVRVESSDGFIDRAGEVMRAWNELNYDIEGEMKLVFDSKPIEIDNHEATEYSIDMAAAMGTAGLPEVRQAMEKLFGPEGKLRLVLCPVDEKTVLMATGTAAQAKAALDALSQESASASAWRELEATDKLLPREAAWRLFVSPHGYTRWLARQMDAVLGPVLGGPVVQEFPASPPLGLAGDFNDREAWIDLAAPVGTIKSASAYLKK